MEEDTIFKVAKEAYVLMSQLNALEDAMQKADKNHSGYQAFARNYNRILERSRVILKIDETMEQAIAHLTAFNPSDGLSRDDYDPTNDFSWDFEKLKAEAVILKATLQAFITFNLPQ